MRKIDIYVYRKAKSHKSCDTDALIAKSFVYYSLKHGAYAEKNTEILRTDCGKPYFKNNTTNIGVTHTNELVFIAFGKENFGIDAEKSTRDVKRREEIEKKYMTESERAFIDAAGNGNAAFLEIWVKKEAYVKYTGSGLRGISGADTNSVGLCFSRIKYMDYIMYICSQKAAENTEIHDLRGD